MRKLLGRAAEDFREPPDPFLMRYVHEVAVAKDIRQAVRASVRLRHFLSRPTVAPPSYKRERKENRDGSCCKNCGQSSLSHILVSLDSQVLRDCQVLRQPWVLTSKVKVTRCLSMAKVLRLIEVSLQRTISADVQGDAMGSTAQQFGVTQF